jgi:GNAT superfamily N-acetyltransferase
VPGSDCPDGYVFSADPDRLDPAWVHEVLAAHAFWAHGRSRETQDAAIAGSRNYGIYREDDGAQVAYARIVTDGVTFAWLADVIVDPRHRGLGLGRALVAGVLAELAPLNLRRVVLKASAEGRGLYESLGWAPVDEPDSWMQRPG